MALENEQQELSQAMEEYRRSLQGLTGATNTAAQAEAAKKKRADEFAAGMESAAKTLTKFGGDLAKGQTDFKSFNAVIDVAADAMGAVAKAMPVVGDAIAGALKAAAEGAKFLVTQIDATSKAFNTMAKTGAVGADGMTGVFRQFTRAGLSLEQFQKQVGDNSTALARFRGMTSDGAEDFSKIVGDLTQGTDDSLRKLGLNAEQMGEGAAAFITQQTRLGRSQTMTNAQLTQGTVQYVKELDLLSKVTGQSRDALQKQQDAALSETRFRSVYQTMINNGNEAAAKELMKFQATVSSASKDTGKALRDLSSGIVDSDEAQALMVATNGKALDIQQRLTSGQISSAQATEELQAAIKANESTILQQGVYNKDAAASFGNIPSMLDFSNSKFDENGKMIAKATATQNTQINKTDELTKEVISAEQNLERMSIEINKLGFTLLPQTAKAVEATTKAMTEMVKYINKELGKTGDEAEETLSGKKGALAGAASMGAAGAVLGSVIPGVGTLIGGAIGAAIGGIAGGTGMIDYGLKGKDGLLETSGMQGNAAMISGAPPSDTKSLLDTIGKVESGGNYNAVVGDAKQNKMDFSKMTIAQVQEYQDQMKKSGKESTAIGKYQMIKSTLGATTKQAGLDPNTTMFTPEVQDQLATQLLKNRGLDKLKEGKITADDFAKNISKEWASLPQDASGKGYYDGVGSNKALIGYGDIKNAIGGPAGGYQPALAAQPPTAPVMAQTPAAPASAVGGADGFMAAQLNKLDELVSVMKTQVSGTEKLIRMQS